MRSTSALHSRALGNHLRPFRERQVGSNDHCGLLGPFGNDLEQELRTYFGQGHVAYFIERDEVVTGPTAQRAAELQLMFGLDHFVDQGSGGSEANPALLPAGGYCQARE